MNCQITNGRRLQADVSSVQAVRQSECSWQLACRKIFVFHLDIGRSTKSFFRQLPRKIMSVMAS